MWTSNPTIRNPLDGTFHDLNLHHAPITAICLTPDQNFALTTDHDGTIFVCMVEFIVDGRLTVSQAFPFRNWSWWGSFGLRGAKIAKLARESQF
jgi:hypothetical protein